MNLLGDTRKTCRPGRERFGGDLSRPHPAPTSLLRIIWSETRLNISWQMGLGAGQLSDLAPSRRGLLRADSPGPRGVWGGAGAEGRRAPPPGFWNLGDSACPAALRLEAERR